MDELQQYGHGGYAAYMADEHGECRLCRWCYRNQYFDGMAQARALVKALLPDMDEQRQAYTALAVRDGFFQEWAFCDYPHDDGVKGFVSPKDGDDCPYYEEV